MLCVSLHTHLSLVVNIVEVFSYTWFGALALDVCRGDSGGGVAGGQAAQGGQTSAAESRCPEEQHDRTAAQTVNMSRNKHGNLEDDQCVLDEVTLR